MEQNQLVLEYLKVLLSWPFMVLILTIFFGLVFREPITVFLKNISGIKLPGGAEITSQATQLSSSSSSAEVPQVGESSEQIEALLTELIQSETGRSHLEDIIKAKDVEIRHWEFNYLNVFLVFNTKRVLYWFSTCASPPSPQVFHSMWAPFILQSNERDAILEALLTHMLISEHNNLITVTSKGLEFINFANLHRIFGASQTGG